MRQALGRLQMEIPGRLLRERVGWEVVLQVRAVQLHVRRHRRARHRLRPPAAGPTPAAGEMATPPRKATRWGGASTRWMGGVMRRVRPLLLQRLGAVRTCASNGIASHQRVDAAHKLAGPTWRRSMGWLGWLTAQSLRPGRPGPEGSLKVRVLSLGWCQPSR